jgi:hypothetical protein
MLVPKKERVVGPTVTRKTRNGEWAEQELSRRKFYLIYDDKKEKD